MKTRHIIIAAVAIILATSCSDKAMLEEFTNDVQGIGLTMKGNRVFSYDENLCQLGYDESLNQFRISDDSMTDYFVLTVDALPDVGSETSGKLSFTTDDDLINMSGLTFKLVKKSPDGLMWFWNKKNAIGAVVRKL